MDPAVAGALIAGGFTTLGTLGTQAIGAWRGNRQELNALVRDETQANRVRLDYLREVLEACAVALHEAGIGLDNAGNTAVWVQQGRLKVTDPDTGKELSARDASLEEVRDFQTSMGTVWRQASRLGVLIPHDHEAYAGYKATADAYRDALVAFDEWHKGDRTGQQLSAALRDAQTKATEAEQRFAAGSRSVIGPKLDPLPT